MNSNDYRKFVKTTAMASAAGFVVIPMGSEVSGEIDRFSVTRQDGRFPTDVEHGAVAEDVFTGTFDDVTNFILGATFLHETYKKLGVINDDQVIQAEENLKLMNTIRASEEDEDDEPSQWTSHNGGGTLAGKANRAVTNFVKMARTGQLDD